MKVCVIATPAASHFDQAREALEAGKDVFVEKPLARTVKEGGTLVELAAKRGRILTVGHLIEYHLSNREAPRELVAQGELGPMADGQLADFRRLVPEEKLVFLLDHTGT